jgi:hypothetical protein
MIADQKERDAALEVARSFIVQAPAGSARPRSSSRGT